MLTQDKIEFFKNKIQEVIDVVPNFKNAIVSFYSNNTKDLFNLVCSFEAENTRNCLEHNFLFSVGYSKLVLLIDEGAGFEYVVKFPFKKINSCSCLETDYCEKELNTYRKIKEDCPEILNLFAECTSFEMEIGNIRIPIYLMERVDVDEDIVVSYSKEGEMDSSKLVNNFFESTLSEEDYPIYFTMRDFLNENDINDIHEGNVGLRKDWTPCIIDYSGYGY